jgi:hypothetical protein
MTQHTNDPIAQAQRARIEQQARVNVALEGLPVDLESDAALQAFLEGERTLTEVAVETVARFIQR